MLESLCCPSPLLPFYTQACNMQTCKKYTIHTSGAQASTHTLSFSIDASLCSNRLVPLLVRLQQRSNVEHVAGRQTVCQVESKIGSMLLYLSASIPPLCLSLLPSQSVVLNSAFHQKQRLVWQ